MHPPSVGTIPNFCFWPAECPFCLRPCQAARPPFSHHLTQCACAADTEAITQEPEAAALYQNRALW